MKWLKTIDHLRQEQVKSYYEVGPGAQLKAMMRWIDTAAFKATKDI